jgi:hypothetical protein
LNASPRVGTLTNRIVFAVALLLAAVSMMIVGNAQAAPSDSATAGIAKAKKKAKPKIPAPRTCGEAVTGVNRALESRAYSKYRLRTAKSGKQRKLFKKRVKAGRKTVNNARASLKRLCAPTGSVSGLDAECFSSITTLDNLINLKYTRKLQLKKVKGKSKKAKKKRRVLTKRLKNIGTQIKTQTTTFETACGNGGSGNGGSGGSGSGGNGGGPTTPADTTPPGAVTIIGPNVSQASSPTYTIIPPDGETGGRIECRVDDAPFATVTSPWTTPTLSDGLHTISCRYVDAAGNAGDATTIVVRVDTTAPSSGPGVEVPGSGPGGENNNQNPVVTVTPPAGEAGGHAECRISGNGYSGEFSQFTEVTSPWTLPTLPEGTYTIICHWVDGAGNAGPDTEYTLVIDRTVPGAPVVTGPSGPTPSDQPQISVSPAEPGGTLRCRVDGGDWAIVTSPFSLPVVEDGTHIVECTQTDAAGNTGEPGQTSVTVDTTAPGSVTITGPDGPTSDTTPSFNLSGAGEGEHYQCRTDGGAVEQVVGNTYTSPVLSDGEHTIECRIVDEAGNPGPTATASVTIDAHAPGSVTITGPSLTNQTTPTLTIVTSEAGGHIECKIDGGAFQTVTSPWTLPGLSEGSHTITCHQVSGTGVIGADSQFAVTVDLTAPSAVTLSGPSGLINTATPAYTLSGGSGGSFECRVDGGSWTATGSAYVTAPLTDGGHTVYCRAVDLAGNATTAVSKNITVDTVAPVVTITDGAARWDGKHDFSIAVNEAGSTVQCKVDGDNYATVGSSLTTGVLANGSHTLTCVGTDTAENQATPVVKPFGVFKDPVTMSKSGGFAWGGFCTGNADLNSQWGCPEPSLAITIPANPNGLTGNYLADISGAVEDLCSGFGLGSTYTLNLLVDGAPVASGSASTPVDFLCIVKKDIAAAKLNLSLAASSSHTVQLALKSTAQFSFLPQVKSSSLSVSIHH